MNADPGGSPAGGGGAKAGGASGGSAPAAGQAPAAGKASAAGNAPAAGKDPAAGKVPAAGKAPAAGRAPVAGRAPAAGKPLPPRLLPQPSPKPGAAAGRGAGPGGRSGSGGSGNPGSGNAGSGKASPDPQGGGAGAAGGSHPRSETYRNAAHQVGGDLMEQNRQQERAFADFRSVNTVVMGDKFELSFGQGSERIRARRISPEELAQPFVSTLDFDRVLGEVEDRRLIVLRGLQGYGKAAAVIRMFARLRLDAATFFFIDPSTDLAAFSCAAIPAGSVLILQDLPETAASRLDEQTLGMIEDELESSECILAITTSTTANLATVSLRFGVSELRERPTPREVFDRHLKQSLVGTGVSAGDVLSWPDVDDLLDTHLSPDCTLAEAARLATLLSRSAKTPDQAAARARAQWSEYTDEKVGQWFRKLEGPAAHCMAISLAVLNGLPQATIAQEAQRLQKAGGSSPRALRSNDPFGADAVISPTSLLARVTTETSMTEHGPIVVRAMRYQEAGFSGQVLRYVWRTRDKGRTPLIEWLRELGTSPDLSIRVRAATAVGVLACEAMDHIHGHILHTWAQDEDPDIRSSAAMALGPPAADPLLANVVRSLVASWSKDDEEPALRASAARAYGRSIGLISPSLALRELARLAEIDDVPLMFSIANSFCELVLEGSQALAARALSEVDQLASARQREKQLTGRLTLLGLSYLRGVPDAMADEGHQFHAWPTLLLLADSSPRIMTLSGRVWAASLNDPDIGLLVHEALDSWAAVAEEDGILRARFVALLTQAVAADPRGRPAVARRAQIWAGRTGKAPKSGKSVLHSLERGFG